MPDSIATLAQMMQAHGAVRVYAKCLQPNDNSRNQIYLGRDFSALNIIPYQNIRLDDSEMAGSKKDRMKADVKFFWIDNNGKSVAPQAQLILYPDYPEVRLGSLLKGAERKPSKTLNKRDTGRVLFLGITEEGEILGFLSDSDESLANEIINHQSLKKTGVFFEVPFSINSSISSRQELLMRLRLLHERGWILSKKMRADGAVTQYDAPNGGGYTLEAELGISPNSYSMPDFLGWEIKQYGVSDFKTYRAKSPITLMTPEPTGGIYKDAGVVTFLKKFGYADQKGRIDRFNFGGIYRYGSDYNKRTNLALSLSGYDVVQNKITDMNGGIILVSPTGEVASYWSYVNIMQHWNRKHAQAAYLPSLSKKMPTQYFYGPKVQLGEGTDLSLFLQAIVAGSIYYDPGIKIEAASTSKPTIKKRSQFRIKQESLALMYHSYETVDLI